MANYPKELLDLVQEYLTDGVITVKERQVLINKAVSLGVDANEFDLYIDAQEQKLQNAAAEAAKKLKGRLCPFCQAPLPILTDKCPECGSNITPEASKEVEEIINSLEDTLESLKAVAAVKAEDSKLTIAKFFKAYFKIAFIFPLFFSSKNKTDNEYEKCKSAVERNSRKAKMYYGNNKTIKFLIEDTEREVAKIEQSISAVKKKNMFIILGVVAFYLVLILPTLFMGNQYEKEQYEREHFAENVIAAVNNGNLSKADQMLSGNKFEDKYGGKMSAEEILTEFDGAYFAVVNAHLNNGNYSSAQTTAIIYRNNINDLDCWRRSVVYTTLKAYCEENDRDFYSVFE